MRMVIADSSPQQSSLAVADGVRLSIETRGPEGAPSLLFAHGFGQTRGAWNGAAAAMAARGFRCVSFDSRGHGQSDRMPGGAYHMEQFIGDLVALAHAQPALEFYSLTGTLTQQAITVDIGAAGASFGIDADISACAGFSTFGGSKDSGGWVCAYASPLLWRTSSDQQAAFNGMLFGVRVFAVSMP